MTHCQETQLRLWWISKENSGNPTFVCCSWTRPSLYWPFLRQLKSAMILGTTMKKPWEMLSHKAWTYPQGVSCPIDEKGTTLYSPGAKQSGRGFLSSFSFNPLPVTRSLGHCSLFVEEKAQLFFFFFFYFNWRLITLQYCIGFAIRQHESTTGIHVFPILNPPPTSLPVPSLWVVPVHQPQASSIMHRTWTGDSFLIWYYTCFNAILPNHSPPHQVQKTVSLLLSHIQGYHYHLSKFHMYALAYCIGVFLSGLLHSV